MKHFGDITKIHGDEVPIVDIVTGGSPCQDLSIAGKRAGLRHTELGDEETTRSGLFMEMIRVIKEMRDADRQRTGNPNELLRPRFMVFENVTGLLSSGEPCGEDFRIVLEETARIVDSSATIPRLPDGELWSNSGAIVGRVGNCPYSLAWRVHNSQFWGVPQRRKRLSLIGDFGGLSAPELLFKEVRFKSEGLSGDSEQSNEKGQGTSADAERSVGESSSYTLKIRGGSEHDANGRTAGKGALIQEELSGTLGVTQDQTLIKVYGISPYESNSMKSSNPNSGIYEAESSRTLDRNGGDPSLKQGGMIVLEGNGSRPSHKGNGFGESDTMYTLNTTEQHGICYSQFKYDKYVETETSASIKQAGGNIGGGERDDSDTIGPLQARDYKGVGDQYVREGKVIVQQKNES